MQFRIPSRHDPRFVGLRLVLVLAIFAFMPASVFGAHQWRVALVMGATVAAAALLGESGTERIRAYFLGAVSSVLLLFWLVVLAMHGVPAEPSERLWMLFVLAIPVVGVALSWFMLRQGNDLPG